MQLRLAMLFMAASAMIVQTPPGKGYSAQEIKDGLFWVSDGAYKMVS